MFPFGISTNQRQQHFHFQQIMMTIFYPLIYTFVVTLVREWLFWHTKYVFGSCKPFGKIKSKFTQSLDVEIWKLFSSIVLFTKYAFLRQFLSNLKNHSMVRTKIICSKTASQAYNQPMIQQIQTLIKYSFKIILVRYSLIISCVMR